METTRPLDLTRLHRPSVYLAGYVHLAAERDTRGSKLSEEQRFNRYPATPFPSLSWIFEGDLRMADGPGRPIRGVILAGPLRRPTTSWSPGPVHALTVSFYPDALSRLLGVRMEAWVDVAAPLAEAVSGEALERLTAVLEEDGRPPWRRVQEALASLRRDPSESEGAADLRSWLAAVTASATMGGGGARQVQRRIKDTTGQSRRNLQLYARVEDAVAYEEEKAVGLADRAARAGFSDQSHLGREVRRVTGLPPGRLEDRIDRDEAFWLYRLLRVQKRLNAAEDDRAQTGS